MAATDEPAGEEATLLDALARAPAAAALVVAALGLEERRALRLAHPQLRDAVDAEITKLEGDAEAACAPMPRCRPRLEALTIAQPYATAIVALGNQAWPSLRTLRLAYCDTYPVAAALRGMPVLRALELEGVALSDEAAASLFRAWPAAAPRLRSLALKRADLSLVTVRALAASGWRLEELDLSEDGRVGDAGVAALVESPSLALRRLALGSCKLSPAAVLAIADAPWLLEELRLPHNDLSADAAEPALAALSQRRPGLRRLDLNHCHLSGASFKVLVEADWPALTSLSTAWAKVEFKGRRALGAAAFAGLPALEELNLEGVLMGAAGARAVAAASRRWPRLRELSLRNAIYTSDLLPAFDLRMETAASAVALARGSWPALKGLDLGDNWIDKEGIAALAHGVWPLLEWLDLGGHRFLALLKLQDVRRWAPALLELKLGWSKTNRRRWW